MCAKCPGSLVINNSVTQNLINLTFSRRVGILN